MGIYPWMPGGRIALKGEPDSQTAAAACLQSVTHRSFYARYIKRPADLAVSTLALIACLPVLLIAALIIVLESPGAPFFTQKRVGAAGREFDIYKLRTMYDGAHAHGFVTRTSDNRITKVGKFLRDTKIDEIPQLWNVIKGDMSIIGPRPLSTDECLHISSELGYPDSYPGFHLKGTPGMTGLEQIYRIHPLVYAERFYWNAFYEDNLSAALDFKIFLTTMLMCNLVCLVTAAGGILELSSLLRSWLWH